MLFLWRGLVNVLAQGKGASITVANGTWHYKIFVGRLFGLIPAQFLWFVGIAVVLGLLYRRHRCEGTLRILGTVF